MEFTKDEAQQIIGKAATFSSITYVIKENQLLYHYNNKLITLQDFAVKIVENNLSLFPEYHNRLSPVESAWVLCHQVADKVNPEKFYWQTMHIKGQPKLVLGSSIKHYGGYCIPDPSYYTDFSKFIDSYKPLTERLAGPFAEELAQKMLCYLQDKLKFISLDLPCSYHYQITSSMGSFKTSTHKSRVELTLHHLKNNPKWWDGFEQ